MKLWAILIPLALLLCLPGCKESSLDTKFIALERGLPDETSFNIKQDEYLDGLLSYTIEAEKMERYSERRLLYGYKVKLSTYDRDGGLNAVIKADTTIVDDARSIIFAMGNASYVSAEGKIFTSKIVWERTIDEITAPAYVIMTRLNDVLRGYNLRTNGKLSYAELERVSAEGIVNEADFDW
ncbi:MAG: LPS export ABC transporter periplasmic protein LptC [Candidatus Cloacimonadaceae bacterium]